MTSATCGRRPDEHTLAFMTNLVLRASVARRIASVVVLIAFASLPGNMGAASAQILLPGAATDRFDVASIKASASTNVPLPRMFRNGEIHIIGVTLRDLIRMAYPAANGQALVEGGPAWLRTDRFDVIAKTVGGAVATAAMLRHLVEERFKLDAHSIHREGNVFALTLASRDRKLGPMLEPTACPGADRPDVAESGCSSVRIGGGPTLIGEMVTMTRLASTLSEFPIVAEPVVDHTGLAGTYSFRMQYRGANDPNPDAGPLLMEALQEQLGLKLEHSTGAIGVVVVDRVERPGPD